MTQSDSSDPLASVISEPLGKESTVAKIASRAKAGSTALGNRVVSTFRMGVVILLVVGFLSMCWRFLDLYEMAVRAETVQAQIALERHRYLMEQLKQGSLTPEQIRQQVASSAAGTPATATSP